MRSPLATRLAASALTVILLGSAAGCADLPGASTPVPTSSASTAGPAQPTAAPTPLPTPPAAPTTPSSGFGAFTADELVQICIDATISAFAADAVFDAPNSRIEHRSVSPEWLVLVPAATSGLDAQAQCTIGGSPSAPVLGMSSASIEPLPEEQIQNLMRGDNEGGDR